jgi:hypothetical protein
VETFFDYKHPYPIFFDECNTSEKNKLLKKTIDENHSYKKYVSSPTRRIHWLIYESKSGNHIGAIGLSSATIAISCRDNFIGWTKDQRLKNLGMLANNSRFCLIRKNITVKNAGSMVLKCLSLNGSSLWKERYNEPLMMIETFVQEDREGNVYNNHDSRNGAVYKSSGYIRIGMSQGNSIRKAPTLLWAKEDTKRGELARSNPEEAWKKYGNYGGKEYIVTKSLPKIMFVKPLVNNWKQILCS